MILQFGCLALVAITGPLLASDRFLFVELVGIALGFWAVYSMRLDNLHITPEVGHNAKLVTNGPYAVIRHPMYAAILLVSLSLVITYFTLFRFIVLLILTIDLVSKLNYEEGLLSKKLNEYKKYKQKTYRLIPFIY